MVSQLPATRGSESPMDSCSAAFHGFFFHELIHFFKIYVDFSIQNRVWSGVLQLGYTVGIGIFLLVSNLS